ncbi:hypothetical protein LCGC14_3100540 [marine sediment metagenome]|uniref:Putative regulatory protein FmdB zinc ribbon domain-containing protein n=1 Tax=marine sediment metagenome TaxID=412755 RepID=A0A0F8W8E7_9ZZZZ|nr:zinc ribbon domain-containing protein [bacterium]
MPIYEYQCFECKKIAEVIQKADDPAPICHGAMKRLMSKNSFILRGSGFYATDYKNKPKENKSDSKNKI